MLPFYRRNGCARKLDLLLPGVVIIFFRPLVPSHASVKAIRIRQIFTIAQIHETAVMPHDAHGGADLTNPPAFDCPRRGVIYLFSVMQNTVLKALRIFSDVMGQAAQSSNLFRPKTACEESAQSSCTFQMILYALKTSVFCFMGYIFIALHIQTP